MKKVNENELKDLFAKIKNNDNIAFEELYNRYKRIVYGITFSILKNKQDAEDVVQVVFEKIYSIDKNKLPNNNEASWLYSVTKNETINFLKKKNNNVSIDSIYDMEDTNNEINKIIDQDSYNRLLRKLNDKEKEIISLKILANLSFEEIGEILNLPTGTVKWKYYKSVHTLKILLCNLSMFLVSFISSVMAFKNGKKSADIEIKDNADMKNNEIKQDDEVTNGYRNEIESIINGDEQQKQENTIKEDEPQTEENIIVDNSVQTNNINYVGVSLMGISSIFLIITITFLIIFIKNQLKGRKKLSK